MSLTQEEASVRRPTREAGVDPARTAAPLSLTVRREAAASRVTLVETHETSSQAPAPPGRLRAGEDNPPGGIVELPSFTDDETSRPTVRMPPLSDRRDRPASIDDAFDTGGEDRAPAPIESEETLPIGGITRTPAPPGPRPAPRA